MEKRLYIFCSVVSPVGDLTVLTDSIQETKFVVAWTKALGLVDEYNVIMEAIDTMASDNR